MAAANDNAAPANWLEMLCARALELEAAFRRESATAQDRDAALAEMRFIADQAVKARAATEAEAALLKRQLLELGGRTIRRVAVDKDGNSVIF